MKTLLAPFVLVFYLVSSSSAAPECNFVVELMHLQDFSSSFANDLPLLETQLTKLFELVVDKFPGSTFGAATFTDKPIMPFGFPSQGTWFDGDWCLNVSTPVGSDNPLAVVNELLSADLGSGNDWPENQIGAMHDVAKNTQMAGWSEGSHNEDGLPIVRVIVMSTDAVYHVAGDGVNASLIPNDGDENTICTVEDYPSIDQLRDALQFRNAYTIVLAGNETGEDVVGAYKELLGVLGTPGEAYSISANSSDIVEAMEEAFEEMAQLICDTPTVDFVLAQDVTYSYRNDQGPLTGRFENFAQNMINSFVEPKFGLTSFGDKPLRPLGSPSSGDYCYRFETVLSSDPVPTATAVASLPYVSGLDWRESQLDAVISSSLDDELVWRPGIEWNGFELVKIVGLATDAGYHRAGDAAANNHTLAPHSGGMVKCIIEDYPSIQTLAEVLLARNVNPLFIPTTDVLSIYENVVEDLEILGVTAHAVDLQNWVDAGPIVTKAIEELTRKVIANRRLL